MQDKAGCSGGAQADGAEQSSHLPRVLFPLPLSLPGTARCTEMLCSVAGFSPVLLIRVCGHIFSLIIFNPHFAYSLFSLFSFPLSRQQNIKKKKMHHSVQKGAGLVGSHRSWKLEQH